MSLFKIKDYSQPKRVKILYEDGKEPSKLTIQKKSEDDKTKSVRNLLKPKKENKAIKERIVNNIKTLFEQQEEDYYKLVRVSNFWNKNYIEYERSGHKNKNLSVKYYINEIKTYLRDIIINLEKSNT